MRGDTRDDWCILRTASRLTLPLAESLAEDGYEVWTPVETVTVRVPRKNARREVRRPIMGSYVFAKAAYLIDLLQLAAMPVKPRRGAGLLKPAHPSFSVLHAFGRIPVVAESDFVKLRELEAKRTPRKVAPYAFPINRAVRVKGGIGQGKVGLVIRSTPTKTKIFCTGDKRSLEIPTYLLELSGAVLDLAA